MSVATTGADAPLVSVIMPTYNRAELLRRSVLSVLAQTYRNLELIVVDDCSTDHTQQVLSEFADARLIVQRRAQNGRAAAARNDGLRAARGTLIAFQDDDDIWLPHKLQCQVDAMLAAGEGVGLQVCAYIRSHRGGLDYIGGPSYQRNLDFARGNPFGNDYGLIATPAWLLRRSALTAAGGEFDTRLRSWDDWELALRLWKTTRIVHLNEPLFVQDHVAGSAMMGDSAAQMEDLKLILQKHGALWEGNRRLTAEHFFAIGWRAHKFVSEADSRSWYRRALGAWPLHLKSWAGLVFSLIGARPQRLVAHVYGTLRWAVVRRILARRYGDARHPLT